MTKIGKIDKRELRSIIKEKLQKESTVCWKGAYFRLLKNVQMQGSRNPEE